jgi:hypothetical protein
MTHTPAMFAALGRGTLVGHEPPFTSPTGKQTLRPYASLLRVFRRYTCRKHNKEM